jgi:hypothetical protein
VDNASHTVSETRYTYDSKGSLLTKYVWNGSTWLSNATPNVYNTNGTPATTYDLANTPTTYGYDPGKYVECGGCTNYPFPTSISKGGLTAYSTWNGIGAKKVTDTDANGATTSYGYTACVGGATDPFWRVMSVADPLGNEVCLTYPSGSSPDTSNSRSTFNSGNSVQNTTTTTDGYGRTINVQTQQAPGSSNYDTVSTTYSWPGASFTVATSQLCSQPLGSACNTVHVHNLDPFGRLSQETTTNNETLIHTYSQNDDLAVLSPAPPGENNKQVQKEYDGLGRITKSCAIGNGSTTACGQNTGSANGVTTSYSYTYAAGSSTGSATRGSQTRSTTSDAMGRVTQVATPEGGTTTYTYDANSGCPGSINGYLTAVNMPANGWCIYRDSLGRITSMHASYSGSGTACRWFYYDNSSGYTGTIPSGITITNSLGRLAEAATDNCAGTHSTNTLITDEWFSYDKDGNMTDMWEMTPHSGQYYHSNATFYGNGKVNTLQLANPSLYTMTYGLDGEGRINTVTDTTTGKNLVTGATYFPAANPAVVSLTGTDNDSYSFDTNTGRMTQFVFTVGNSPKSLTGNLSWNQNGTLKQLAIIDGFNSGGTQTCNFNPLLATGTGYDDWGRLIGVDCGSGQWGQTFSYDIYDNLSKSQIAGRQGTNWLPGYSTTTNHCNGCTYDANGDVTGDGNNVYGWNEFSKVKWTAASGTPTCGSSGRCAVYDAFGRIVERSVGSTWYEQWFTQGGTAWMSGATVNYAYWPAPGGGKVLLYGNSQNYDYLHADWLGNARIDSDLIGHTVATDQSYSPYGELYDIFGSNVGQNKIFATMNGNFAPGTTTPIMWDTPNRELSMVGRWLSPDPAGAGWNQYAYSTNPNSQVDPSGSVPIGAGFHTCAGSGPNPSSNGCDSFFFADGTEPGILDDTNASFRAMNSGAIDPIQQLMNNFNAAVMAPFAPALRAAPWENFGSLYWQNTFGVIMQMNAQAAHATVPGSQGMLQPFALTAFFMDVNSLLGKMCGPICLMPDMVMVPDEPEPLILANSARGLAFENDVLGALGATKNTASITVDGETAIPDIIGPGRTVTEIKDRINVFNTAQLRTEAAWADTFNLIVSPRTEYISAPVQQAVYGSGGTIQVYSPATGAFTPWQ